MDVDKKIAFSEAESLSNKAFCCDSFKELKIDFFCESGNCITIDLCCDSGSFKNVSIWACDTFGAAQEILVNAINEEIKIPTTSILFGFDFENDIYLPRLIKVLMLDIALNKLKNC